MTSPEFIIYPHRSMLRLNGRLSNWQEARTASLESPSMSWSAGAFVNPAVPCFAALGDIISSSLPALHPHHGILLPQSSTPIHNQRQIELSAQLVALRGSQAANNPSNNLQGRAQNPFAGLSDAGILELLIRGRQVGPAPSFSVPLARSLYHKPTLEGGSASIPRQHLSGAVEYNQAPFGHQVGPEPSLSLPLALSLFRRPSLEGGSTNIPRQHISGVVEYNQAPLELSGAGHIPKADDTISRQSPEDDFARAIRSTLGYQTFPWKLHHMLSECQRLGRTDVISWVAQGTAFQILKPRALERDILHHFFGSQRLKSLQRQLHMYGFRRLRESPHWGAYAHDCFRRDQPQLLHHMVRHKQLSQISKKRRHDPKHAPSVAKIETNKVMHSLKDQKNPLAV